MGSSSPDSRWSSIKEKRRGTNDLPDETNAIQDWTRLIKQYKRFKKDWRQAHRNITRRKTPITPSWQGQGQNWKGKCHAIQTSKRHQKHGRTDIGGKIQITTSNCKILSIYLVERQ